MLNRFTLKPSPLKLKNALTVSLLLILLSGCMAHYGAVTVTSTPPGAKVIKPETGEVLGVTPLFIEWVERRGTRKQVAFNLEKEGYYLKTGAFWVNMDSRSAKKAKKAANLVEIPMQKIGE